MAEAALAARPEKAVRSMLEESIRLIQGMEQHMEKEKLAARERAQRQAAQARKDAAAILAEAEETLRQERRTLLAQADGRAAARREDILAGAEEQCRALTAQAAQRREEAVERLLAEGV